MAAVAVGSSSSGSGSDQPTLFDINKRSGHVTGTEDGPDIEAWITEARTQRERTYDEHRLLVGAALREELAAVRLIGKAQRHRRRLELAAKHQEEQ